MMLSRGQCQAARPSTSGSGLHMRPAQTIQQASRALQCRAQGETHAEQSSAGCDMMRSVGTAALAALLTTAVTAHAVWANDKIAEFEGSGFLFKDTVEVISLDDPEIAGVTLYISNFQRSLVDRLAKDFFTEPSQASLTCAITGPVSLRQGDIGKLAGPQGKELFSESKGLNLFKNKTLRVRRIIDAQHNTAVYVAFSTRMSSAADDGVSSGRYRTSLCAVHLPDAPMLADN